MLGVTDNRAKLWVDCRPVASVAGYLETPLRERGRYDIEDGYLSVAQIANTPMSYSVSTLLHRNVCNISNTKYFPLITVISTCE